MIQQPKKLLELFATKYNYYIIATEQWNFSISNRLGMKSTHDYYNAKAKGHNKV